MSRTITQKITFKNQQASKLYAMYLDSKLHALITGGQAAKIKDKVGSAFFAHGGYCYGKILQLVKNRMIVQSWRATDWKKSDLDSNLILIFEQKGNDSLVTMIHANVPDDQALGLKSGWKDFYWMPWKDYLRSK